MPTPNVTILKSLYNIYQQNATTQKNIAANAQLASATLEATIALAKAEAYTDCAAIVYSMISQQVPPYGSM
jgi:hypothetical protein